MFRLNSAQFVFSAANVTSNIGDWKNGPEVIYDAKINYLNYHLDNPNRTFIDNVTMKFMCRPKKESRLSCRIHDPITSSIVLFNDKKDKKLHANDPFPADRMGGVFELDFDSQGLKEIIMDESSFGGLLNDVVKSLADQLNIGADLPSTSVFSIATNTTTGQCETDYIMSSGTDSINNDVDKHKGNASEIVIVPIMRGLRGGAVKDIKKSVSAFKCPYRYQYYDRDWNQVGHGLNGRTDPPNFYFEYELVSISSS